MSQQYALQGGEYDPSMSFAQPYEQEDDETYEEDSLDQPRRKTQRRAVKEPMLMMGDIPVQDRRSRKRKAVSSVKQRSINPKDSDSEDEPTGESTLVSPARNTKYQRVEHDASEPEMIVLYTPGGMLPSLQPYLNKILEVRVDANYLTTKNREIQRSQLWGSDIYTDDSDVAAILMHTGSMIVRSSAPSSLVGISVYFRILPGQSKYESSNRFGLRSRDWVSPYDKCSLQLIRSEIIQTGALTDDKIRSDGKTKIKILRMPIMDKSSSRMFAKAKRRTPDIALVYNSNNDLCLKYSLELILNIALDRSQWASARLKREALYLETNSFPPVRYELIQEPSSSSASASSPSSAASSSSSSSSSSASPSIYSYRWSRVRALPFAVPRPDPFVFGKGRKKRSEEKAPHTTTNTNTATQPKQHVPLEPSEVEVLASNVDWSQIEWAPEHLTIQGVQYPVFAMFWRSLTAPVTASAAEAVPQLQA